MPTIHVAPGVNMAYEDRGEGDPIVFVHGWGGAGDVWDYQVLDFAPTHRCITVDLRGHGASDKPWGTYDYELFAEDLHTLITALDLTGVTLVGWSMGGHIGIKYVHEHPERIRRLVITGSGPRFWHADDAPYGTPSDQVKSLIDAVRWARTETIAGLYGNNFHRQDLSATEQWFIQTGWKVPAFVGLTSFQALIDNDLRPLLPEITRPVSVFSGRHDQIWDPRWSEETARLLPDSTLTFFENSGHVAFIENRVEWNAALLDVLEGRTPARSLGALETAATA